MNVTAKKGKGEGGAVNLVGIVTIKFKMFQVQSNLETPSCSQRMRTFWRPFTVTMSPARRKLKVGTVWAMRRS